MSTSTVTPDLLWPERWSRRRAIYTASVALAIIAIPFAVWPALTKRIFTSNFLPHRYCYLEQAGLVWTHVVSDSLIGLAYLVISVTLGYLVYKGRRDIPFHWMFLAFGLFIVACGGTHFVEVLTIWIPVYIFSAAVKIFTAVASVLTAIFLPFTVPRVLSLVQTAKNSGKITAQLRESEGRIRAITETASDAIVSADANGNIIYFNRAAECIFGYSASEATGKPLTLLMPERFQASHQKGLRRFLDTGETRIIGTSIELIARRKDGHEFPVSASLSAWEASGKKFFTGILRDISDRKRNEDELRIRNAQLEAANKELEAFSYSVSHDLRAPLRAIDGFSLAILEDFEDKLNPDGQDQLQRIRLATRRMGQLIDDMLKLSRIVRSEMVHDRFDLSQLAQEVAAQLQASAPDRNVTCTIAPNLMAEGDRNLLRIVLENLLGNAWKFTSKQAMASIEFGAQKKNGEEIYFVRDNGVGFDMNYVSKLFGAFQRMHSENEFPGTGIGLATVQRIIHRHGGKVWAEGSPDQGASFYFVLRTQATT